MLRSVYHSSLSVLPTAVSNRIRGIVGRTYRLLNPPAPALPASPLLMAPEPIRFDGEHSKQWWRTRDEQQSSAEGFWNQREHPARTAIGEEIAKLDGSSLLEVGCHAGPNLWAVTQRKLFDRVAGTEISPTILSYAKDTLPHRLGRSVDLREAYCDDLPFADGEFDITLLSVTLCCIGPEEILQSLDEVLRVTRRWIVIAEPFDDDPDHGTPLGLPDNYPNTTYWIRNYAALLKGRASLASVRHLEAQHQMGHIRSVMVFQITAG